MQPAYPVASPPRRVSNGSPPPYPLGLPDASLHRDKRARLDLYSERAQPATEAMLRPPPLRTASSYRSIASAASASTGWHDRSDLHERRPRDGADASYHGDGASKGARNVEWASVDRAHPTRRTSALSHHTLDAGTTASSEVPSLHSQSSKVKRRKRAVLSCTECKQRKIKCDRNVPNCGSCVRRGVAHLCRWGDERDYLPAAPASNITPSNAALMARIAQLESQVRVLQSSPNSPSAVHGVAGSERSSGQRGVSKYGASESSSGPSSRYSGQSGIQRPPDFTSRDRNATTRGDAVDGRYVYDDEEEEEEESEQSDESVESGAEDAGDLLRALATGTSLKNNSRQGPSRREHTAAQDEHQADGVQQDGKNGLSAEFKRGSRADNRQTDGRDGKTPSSSLRRRSLLPEEDLASAAMFSIFSTDASSSRKEALRSGLLEALDLLPPRHKTEALIDHYLREAEAVVGSFHRPSLLRELSAFWRALDDMKDATAPASTPLPDLQFGALLLAMCEAACEFMTPAEVLDSEICDSRTSINDCLAMLARSCLALLGMGQFVRRPNIWGMQAVIVLRHYAFNRDHREEYAVLFTMAIKAAEFMGLHRLGSALTDEDRWEDEMRDRARLQASGNGKGTGSSTSHRWKLLTSTQITDGHETESDGEDLDPDRDERKDMNAMWLPRGSKRKKWDVAATKRYKEGSRVSREHGRKVWFALATLDWLCASHFDRVYHCKDEMFTTQSPQNIDDSDLTDSDSTTFEVNSDRAPGRPPRVNNIFLDKIRVTSIPTTNSYIPIHIEICHTVRSISDALNQGEESFDTVLAIEARFREILRSLPRFYKLDGESEYDPEIHRLHKERPYLSTQRAIIHESVHHRLLKLHRLYMSRGYWNAKYIHSTRTCIESARVVMGVLRALDNAGCRGQRYWIFKFHIFHAVLALQVDLLYLARQPVNREILAKRADVVAGLKMLHARTDVEGRNPMLASSLKVIKVLREEEQARRSKIRTSAEASAGSEPNSVSSPAGSAESQKRSKAREWTSASESTGDLADHLERRVRETWYTVDADKLRAVAEAASSLAADARSPVSELPTQASAMTPTSTEDGSSLRTADAVTLAPTADGRDTELDDYLKLLSSYQNPDDAPDGAHFFDVLDDMVFENGSANKVKFSGRAVKPPLTSTITPPLPLLRGANDLAAAGAGFDAFTAA
uniref:Zn(2)-C6 fungal-type domain-containing protein n=2 Tax=Kalmanozyma brasiliensis (strain GHG001) TaxID=1365824 RepID=V5EW02_KALBG